MICGIDEAGRGCLAGPLIIAGCVLDTQIHGLADSKKISPKKRDEFYKIIIKNTKFLTVEVSNNDIDTLGLSVCMSKALNKIKEYFNNYDIIFDGNTNFGVSGIKTIIKADTFIPQVSAASIIAKVTRDNIMTTMDLLYPQYGFKQHKGYGTSLHVKNIQKYGHCPLHRKSFKVKSLIQKKIF